MFRASSNGSDSARGRHDFLENVDVSGDSLVFNMHKGGEIKVKLSQLNQRLSVGNAAKLVSNDTTNDLTIEDGGGPHNFVVHTERTSRHIATKPYAVSALETISFVNSLPLTLNGTQVYAGLSGTMCSYDHFVFALWPQTNLDLSTPTGVQFTYKASAVPNGAVNCIPTIHIMGNNLNDDMFTNINALGSPLFMHVDSSFSNTSDFLVNVDFRSDSLWTGGGTNGTSSMQSIQFIVFLNWVYDNSV